MTQDDWKLEGRKSQLLAVDEVAGKLSCSPRHVYRLRDTDRMPKPVKVGALVRWSNVVIEAWIAEGCPACREEVSQ
jgi:predicted DNA-binding transcriptional regulator AlpA